jgi:hypothetical protein
LRISNPLSVIGTSEQRTFPRVTRPAWKWGKTSSRQPCLELIAVYALLQESFGHRHGFGAEPVRVEMDHHASVCVDGLHRRVVGVDVGAGAVKDLRDV